MKFDIKSFTTKIICKNEITDAATEATVNENELDIFITATEDKPEFIELHWDADTSDNLYILGDAWERSYGNLCFLKIQNNDRYMPWYFIATDKEKCMCFGIKTKTNAFVSFRYDINGITALIDIRNGGNGVHLNGRKLHACTFVKAEYDNADILENLKDFCKKLCEAPLLPKERIYGGNNWYYAYGDSCYEQIISDAKFQVELAKGIDNKPFEVVDDCWSVNDTEGPWIPNEKFRDMKKLADEIRKIGARPGIWVRFLHNKDEAITEDMRIDRDGEKLYLDPTHPAVQSYLKDDIERLKAWGYELVKHDFSTVDLFGDYGCNLNATITNQTGWHFYDKTKTNAEIVVDFYRLIKENAGDMLIIGCDTVSHLSAGYVHLSRTGDDTSGVEWERTRKMGVNTLAFRLAHNENFYMCDADCVGILDKNIPWEKNSQWLHLLSYSNTPLFISCTDQIDDIQKADISKAYKTFNMPHTIRPIDIYENLVPCEWEIDGKIKKYNWD